MDAHFEESLLVLLLVLITCVEMIQVTVRNIPFIPSLTWAEEFCRFCWIWSVFLSLPYTLKMSNMLRVSVLLDLFPQKTHNIINVVIDLINATVMFGLGVASIPLMQRIIRYGEFSPAMKWPMWFVYGILLIGFFLAAARAMQQAYFHLKDLNGKSFSTLDMVRAEAAEETESAKKMEGLV